MFRFYETPEKKTPPLFIWPHDVQYLTARFAGAH